MSQHSKTIRYYDDHADEYVRGTVGMDMEALYQPFLELVPTGGKILDAGCGSGRDSKAFMDRGYEVTAIDASQKMVEATSQLTGQSACLMRLQEITFEDEFDGAWACASLLHVPMDEIGSVLDRISRALRINGVIYSSFKVGEGERQQGERWFTDFTESSLEICLASHSDLQIVRIWVTDDLRPGRSERWVNALARKRV